MYTFIVKGRKWWDKINGNTYNSAKILVLKDNERIDCLNIDYEYGYGNDYLNRSINKIKEYCTNNNIDYHYNMVVDMGADYDKKTNVKNYQY